MIFSLFSLFRGCYFDLFFVSVLLSLIQWLSPYWFLRFVRENFWDV